MRIISERRIREFYEQNRDAESAFQDWIRVVRRTDWRSFSDIRRTFNHADIHERFTIFDVGGNKFRIIAKIEYSKHIVFIRSVLTHAEYDRHSKWCECGQR